MRRGLLTTLALVILTAAASAEDRLDVDGYFKSFFVVYKMPSVSTDGYRLNTPPLGSVANRLRFSAHLTLQRDISFAMSYDFAPRVQDRLLFDQPLTVGTIDPLSYRFDDLRPRMYPSCGDEVASFAIFHNLDRAFFEFRTDRVDIFVGRQPIARGSADGSAPW